MREKNRKAMDEWSEKIEEYYAQIELKEAEQRKLDRKNKKEQQK